MKLLPLSAVALCVGGCSNTPFVHRDSGNELVRQGVYATRDAIDAGRFDQADDYSAQTVKLVPPPRRRIIVRPISK